jgi:hypothetical protein
MLNKNWKLKSPNLISEIFLFIILNSIYLLGTNTNIQQKKNKNKKERIRNNGN